MEMRITHPAPAVDLSATFPPGAGDRGREFALLMTSVARDGIAPAGKAVATSPPNAEAACQISTEGAAPCEQAGSDQAFAACAQDDTAADLESITALSSEFGSVHGPVQININNSTIATEPAARESERDDKAEQFAGPQQVGASLTPAIGASRMGRLHSLSNVSDSVFDDAIASKHPSAALTTVMNAGPALGPLTMNAAKDLRHAMAPSENLLAAADPHAISAQTPRGPGALPDVIYPAAMTDIASPSDYSDRRNGLGALPSHVPTTDIATVLRDRESIALNTAAKSAAGNIDPSQSNAIPAHTEAAGQQHALKSAVSPLSPYMQQMDPPNLSAQVVNLKPTAAYDLPQPGAGYQSSFLTTDIVSRPPTNSQPAAVELSSSMGILLQNTGSIKGNAARGSHPFAEADELGNAELRMPAGSFETNQVSRHASIAATTASTLDAQLNSQALTDASVLIASDEEMNSPDSDAARLDAIAEQRLQVQSERISQPPSTSAHPARQLGDAIIRGSSIATETELVLTPEELGKVRFAINQHDGVLTISVSADRPDTLALLRRHADMLLTDLAQSGLGDATLDFGTSGGDRDRDDGRSTWAAPTNVPSAELSELQPSSPARQHATRPGRIDLRL